MDLCGEGMGASQLAPPWRLKGDAMKATTIKERPILFSPEMVRAILRESNPKTQTRRVIVPQPVQTNRLRDMEDAGPKQYFVENGVLRSPARHGSFAVPCPYGEPGDRLIPICSWAVARKYDNVRPLDLSKRVDVWTYHDGAEKPETLGKLRPGRYMPTWMRAAIPRLELIAKVRVQRLQDISEEDAKAEGVIKCGAYFNGAPHKVKGTPRAFNTAREALADIWDSINGKRSPWSANEWVWALTFKRLEQP